MLKQAYFNHERKNKRNRALADYAEPLRREKKKSEKMQKHLRPYAAKFTYGRK